MAITLKKMVRLLTPPLFVQLARRFISPKPDAEWVYVPDGWSYAKSHPEVRGWNVLDILEVYKQKWPRFVDMVQGSGPLGMTHESTLTTSEDIIGHNAMMAYAYVLATASRHKDRLSMLDWGGGIGHYYLLAQALLPGVEVEYYCKDVSVLCEYGEQIFPRQHFYADERCFDRVYDFVMASTSMHYTEDWRMLLQRLADVTSGYLYVANLPVVQQAPSFVFIQRPYRYGYNTEYLAWCLNHTEFLLTAEKAGLHLLREFVYGHQPFIQGAPEQNVYRGYLFEANAERKSETGY